jgi:hypothetical protein
MRYFIIFFYIGFSSLNAFAQIDPLKQLLTSIRSFTDDDKLNDFLRRQKLIPHDNTDSANHFHVSEMKIDVFRKNLFGDAKEEVILQLRDPESYAINIFYYDQQQLKKTPGNIIYFKPFDIGFSDQKFNFSFENIFAENEFSVIVKRPSGFNRSAALTVELHQVNKDTIMLLYDFSAHEYSSSFTSFSSYSNSLSNDYSFKLVNNAYPKVLIQKVTSYSMEQNGYDVGREDSSSYIEQVIFSQGKSVVKKTNIHNKQKLFVLSSKDLKYM